jgi:translation initiation factor IF-2
MIVSIIISVILAILVVALLALLNKRTKEKAYLEKQEKRSWLLKVALEKSCKLPTVESDELAKIEPQIDNMTKGNMSDKELEEKMRELIMGLYEEKINHEAKHDVKKEKGGTPSKG